MTTPAQLTYIQIETRVMNQLRIPTSNSVEQAKIQALINEVYRDIYVKHDWWWAVKRTVVNTVARINAGTLSITNGSTAVTFSTAPGLITGYVLLLTGDTNDPGSVYRVASTGTGTAQTLDAAMTGATSTSISYNVYQDAIPLPSDVGKMLQVKRYGEFRPLRLVGPEEIARFKISDTTVGKPELASIFDLNTTGDPTSARLLQIHPYPDKTYRLEILYKQQLNTELTGSIQPFIPDDYRQILIYGALARGYPIFLNDIERGKFFQSLFNDLLSLMVAVQREYAADRPQIVPEEGYRRARRRPRTAVTLGSWFDRLPADF